MKHLSPILHKFFDRDKTFSSEAGHLESLTRVILQLMGVTLLVFSPIVILIEFFFPPPGEGLIVLAVLDIPILIAWLCYKKGMWKIAGNIPLLLFLSLGFWGTATIGLSTITLMFYVLAVVLAGMLLPNARQLVVYGTVVAGASLLVWFRDPDIEMVLVQLITFGGLLLGISLLQMISSDMTYSALRRSNALADDLRVEAEIRREKESQVLRLNEELENRVLERTAELDEKNKELEAFAYSIAHDLRAPVRAIIGLNQILREEQSHILGKTGLNYIDRSIAAGNKMNALIDGLLSLSRLGQSSLYYETIPISELVIEIFNEIAEPGDRDRIRFIVTPCEPIQADRMMTKIMLVNLISNAIKYTRSCASPEIEFGYQKGENPGFFLRDNGVGFSMEFADKIFSPFERIHNEEGQDGVGIGLSIVKRVIDRHGGKIWVQSRVNQGTTFFFTL